MKLKQFMKDKDFVGKLDSEFQSELITVLPPNMRTG